MAGEARGTPAIFPTQEGGVNPVSRREGTPLQDVLGSDGADDGMETGEQEVMQPKNEQMRPKWDNGEQGGANQTDI